MTQPSRHAVALHRGADRLGHHQTYFGSVVTAVRKSVVQRVHDEIGLNRPYSLTNRDTEIRRPCHPVPGRKHCPEPCVESRSQGAAALAAAARHDGTAGTGTHAQPETVHTGPAAVVRLKSPLALGHGCFSSFGLVSTPSITMTVMAAEDAATVGKLIHLAGAAPLRFSREPPSRSRIATCGRLLEGTDEICLGQTWPDSLADHPISVSPGNKSHTCHPLCRSCQEPVGNVAERLALREKTVSFSQCRFEVWNGAGTRAGMTPAARPQTTFGLCRAPTRGPRPQIARRFTTDYCPQSVDNYVDSLLSSPPGTSRGSR